MRMHHLALLLGLLATTGVVFAAKGGGAQTPKTWQYGAWSAMLTFKGSSGDSINYYLFTPKTVSGKVPFVVFLHGGTGSNGIGGPSCQGDLFYNDAFQKDHPCFVVRPVAIQGQNWVSPIKFSKGSHAQPAEPSASMKVCIELLDKLIKDNPIDESRLYAYGPSMGGYGTWDIIERFPNKFAAAMPICGGGDPSKADSLKNMAIWIAHGDKDQYVPFQGSVAMFDAIMKARGETAIEKDRGDSILKMSADERIKFTQYKGGNHNSGWEKGCSEPGLEEWFFSKKLGDKPGAAGAKAPAAKKVP